MMLEITIFSLHLLISQFMAVFMFGDTAKHVVPKQMSCPLCMCFQAVNQMESRI